MDNSLYRQSPRGKVAARWILGGALLYSLVARVAYLLWSSDNSPFFLAPISDAVVYHNRALEIMQGKLLSDHGFYQAPLYPYFLGAVYYLFGPDAWPIRIVQASLGLGNIFLIYLIARYQTTAVWAAVAAALAALYFGFPFHESFLLLDTLGLHLFLWALFLSLRATYARHRSSWVLAGVAIGLACLSRPNALLLLPFLFLWLAIRGRKHLQTAGFSIGALFLGVGIAIAPATLHNWAVDHKFSLITTNAGTTFLFGNNPSASGILSLPPGFSGNILTQRQEELQVAQRLLNKPMTQDEAGRYWLHRTLQFLAENPKFTLHLEYLKFRRLINNDEFPDNYSMKYDSNPYKLLMPLPFAVIFGLSIWGMMKTPWTSPASQLTGIFLLVPVATVMIFYMTSRYRLPAMPMLIIFAAAGMQSILYSLRSRQWLSIAFAISLIGFAIYASFKPMKEWDSVASWWVREGMAWLDLKRPDKALERFALARQENPREKGLWLNTAFAYYRKNQLQEALEAANQAEKVEPAAVKPQILGLKGAILLDLKQYADAERLLKQAAILTPHNGQISLALANLYYQTKRYADARIESQKALANGVALPLWLQEASDTP